MNKNPLSKADRAQTIRLQLGYLLSDFSRKYGLDSQSYSENKRASILTSTAWRTHLTHYFDVETIYEKMSLRETGALASFVLLIRIDEPTDLYAILTRQPNSRFFERFGEKYFSSDSKRVMQEKLKITADSLHAELQENFHKKGYSIHPPLKHQVTYYGIPRIVFPVMRLERLEII